MPRFGRQGDSLARLLQFYGRAGLAWLPLWYARSHELRAEGGTSYVRQRGWLPARPAKSRRPIARRPANLESAVEVVVDLPALVPVTQGEIEVIETYLGALVDEALAGTGSEISRKKRTQDPSRKLLAGGLTASRIEGISGANP